MKHKLEYVTGCVCTSLMIDGEETIDMDINSFKEVIKEMVCLEYEGINDLIHDFIIDMISDYTVEPKVMLSQDDNYEIQLFEKEVGDVLISYVDIFYDDMFFINHRLWDKKVDEKIIKMVYQLIDETEDIAIFQTFFCDVIEKYGIMEDGYPHFCDCCGDMILSYTMEI